jgi:pyruvate/2-oxoglutarate dehydrogenase complex dihydrolipoamide dehydrogenase (E3) component
MGASAVSGKPGRMGSGSGFDIQATHCRALIVWQVGKNSAKFDLMQIEHYDYVVIGGGSAGYAAARTAREKFDRVAIVDSGSELGGLCILRGCMPSKTLIYSAEVLHLANHGDKFGLSIPQAAVNWPELHKRKVAMVDDFKSYRQQQLQSDRYTLIRETASFVDQRTLLLQPSGRTITSDFFMIATGSQPAFPDIPGLRQPGVWTSDDVLDLKEDPESVIVLGGGVVACELAQFLNRAGVKTIQIQRSPRILKEYPESASEVLSQAMRDEGVELYTDTKIESVNTTEFGYEVSFHHQGRLHKSSAKHLFNALGRTPVTANLGLENAGVQLKKNGQIAVNDWQQTTAPGIYAAGDVCGPYEIVHVAILQGELAAKHALGVRSERIRYDHLTSVVFTDPQIATVGITNDTAPTIEKLLTATYPFDDHGKSILMEARYGYVKVWVDAGTGQIKGAECVGKDASELIHSLAVGVTLGATVQQLLQVQWYHPTLSEIWTYPLEEIAEQITGYSNSTN